MYVNSRVEEINVLEITERRKKCRERIMGLRYVYYLNLGLLLLRMSEPFFFLFFSLKRFDLIESLVLFVKYDLTWC